MGVNPGVLLRPAFDKLGAAFPRGHGLVAQLHRLHPALGRVVALRGAPTRHAPDIFGAEHFDRAGLSGPVLPVPRANGAPRGLTTARRRVHVVADLPTASPLCGPRPPVAPSAFGAGVAGAPSSTLPTTRGASSAGPAPFAGAGPTSPLRILPPSSSFPSRLVSPPFPLTSDFSPAPPPTTTAASRHAAAAPSSHDSAAAPTSPSASDCAVPTYPSPIAVSTSPVTCS
jgi:hypothetical protein